jgi:nucleoside phosphorylase
MIYIVVALKAEAQAFVDKKIPVSISGMGRENMYKATKTIVDKMDKNDIIVNVGICGASDEYKISQLIDGIKENITCVDKPITDKQRYKIVDMESCGFLEATKGVKNRYIFKVVSDHFEPHKVTKDGAKKLVFDKIDEILNQVQNDGGIPNDKGVQNDKDIQNDREVYSDKGCL